MGHAHHFLSRLDRVAPAHVELALSLYNDAPLLQHILGRLRLPDGAERVALSLHDPEDGPFLVVTRDGRFVTCLGAGMRVTHSHLPVVPRAHLDALATQGTTLRARIEAASAFSAGSAGSDTGIRALVQRVYTAGAELPREEFVTLAGLALLLGPRWRAELLDLVIALEDARPQLVELADALTRPVTGRASDAIESTLHTLWHQLWAVGHLCLLGAADGPKLFDDYEDDARGVLAELFANGPAAQGVVGLSLRGAWATGRLGKPVLAAQKQAFRAATKLETVTASGLALTTLGLRHAKLNAEVCKLLESHAGTVDIPQSPPCPAPAADDPDRIAKSKARLEYARGQLRANVATFAADVLARPDEWRALHLGLGREVAVALTSRRAASSGLRFARAEDVPDDFALTASLNDLTNFFAHPEMLTHVFARAPYLAQADAAQFYYPRAQLPAAGLRYHPDLARPIVAALHTHFEGRRARVVRERDGAKTPRGSHRADERPGRNEPCHCGSGKKFKRCHGA